MRFEICILALAVTANALTGAVPCVEKVPEGGDPAAYTVCRENPHGHDSPVAVREEIAQIQSAEEIASECGELGVMEVPEGEDPSLYRKCRDHPLGHARGVQLAPASKRMAEIKKRNAEISPAHYLERRRIDDLKKRACWWGPYWYGCSDHSCWASCGPNYQQTGAWCWLAINSGRGEWAKCSNNEQCNLNNNQDLKCGGGCSC
ncbi:hypothetical protein B0J11DRAFT_564113 [Dendryphion nanum]|uniref:Uncharacterized protein n=1 Tax=Dendryphion nanum TaxID=256645 RepID=A0A9P9J2V2_9PLEO|nr:hypothetical protein B0J11DRAFT_564113 [Dendryphion nanum]